jgi:hypothetical protein
MLSSKDAAYSDLALPTEGTLAALNELATAKISEIIGRSLAGEDGFDLADLEAVKEQMSDVSQHILT